MSSVTPTVSPSRTAARRHDFAEQSLTFSLTRVTRRGRLTQPYRERAAREARGAASPEPSMALSEDDARDPVIS